MKKPVIISFAISVILFCIFGSCGQKENRPNAPIEKRMSLDSSSLYQDENYKVYTLEGCEYIVYGYGDSRWGTHKGNCKNHIHEEHYTTDTDYFEEKHFDCTVVSCEYDKDSNLYAITTECGIQFYDNKSYDNGDVLSKFKSPKHK